MVFLMRKLHKSDGRKSVSFLSVTKDLPVGALPTQNFPMCFCAWCSVMDQHPIKDPLLSVFPGKTQNPDPVKSINVYMQFIHFKTVGFNYVRTASTSKCEASQL